jgi:hypothetical protein
MFEEHLEEQAHDYAKKPRKARAMSEEIETMLNDPQAKRQFEDFWKQTKKDMISNQSFEEGVEEDFTQSMLELASLFRRMGEAKLAEMREQMDSYKAWQIVTEPILDSKNRERWRNEFFSNLGMS